MPHLLLVAVGVQCPAASHGLASAFSVFFSVRFVLIAAVLLLLGPLTFAADATEPPAEVTVDEVVVRAARLRLDEQRREIERLEDQIYARYNDLNTDDNYDVICSDYTRTGTQLTQRYCRPMFEEQAKIEEGRVAFQALQLIRESQKMAGSVQLPESPVPKILAQMPAYQKHMKKIVEKDPQLRRLLRERAAVAEQMERTRKEMFGKK